MNNKFLYCLMYIIFMGCISYTPEGYTSYNDSNNIIFYVDNEDSLNFPDLHKKTSRLEVPEKVFNSNTESIIKKSIYKKALLIANNDYNYFSQLTTPIEEALQLKSRLVELGFDVFMVQNASRDEILDSIYNFELEMKGNGGLAFFHYGGHAVQVDGKNYIIPIDANIPDERRVSMRAVDTEEIMASLDSAGSETNIIILDSCRDNPLPASTRSSTRGLAVVSRKPKNSIIVYSAESGTTAQDGVFTPILTEFLSTPDKSFQEILQKVRKAVFEKTDGIQIPGAYDQTFDPIYLSDYTE